MIKERAYKSTNSRCGKCAKCQIFGTFTTPNTKMTLYEMCQISKIIQHSYSIVANLQRYRQMWQNFFIVFYSFSLSSPFIFSFLFSLTLRFPLFSLKPQSSPLNLSLSLCLPLPVSLGAVALLDLGASVFTKTLTFAVVFSAFRDSIPWLIALAFFFARGSSRSLSSSCSLSTRLGGPIGPRRRSCLG